MRMIGIGMFAVFCLAAGYATVVLNHDHSQTWQIREECRRAHIEADTAAECVTGSALRHARQAQLP